MAAHSRKFAADDEASSVRVEAKEFGLGRAGVISLAPTGHNCSFFKGARILKKVDAPDRTDQAGKARSLLTGCVVAGTSPSLFRWCAQCVHLSIP